MMLGHKRPRIAMVRFSGLAWQVNDLKNLSTVSVDKFGKTLSNYRMRGFRGTLRKKYAI